MSKICGIYKITSPTGRIYIGQSTNIERRRKHYNTGNCKSQTKLYASIMKHGFDNHLFEVVEECSLDDLNEREIHFIKVLNTFNTKHGMNLRSGSANGLMSDESKRLISKNSASRTRNFKHTEETKQLLRELRLKQKCPSTGKRSPEICEKFRVLNTGRTLSEASRKKLSESLKNSDKFQTMMRSDERRAITSRTHKGKVGHTYWLGKNRSEEVKAKISEGLKGKTQSQESIDKRVIATKLTWERKRNAS